MYMSMYKRNVCMCLHVNLFKIHIRSVLVLALYALTHAHNEMPICFCTKTEENVKVVKVKESWSKWKECVKCPQRRRFV